MKSMELQKSLLSEVTSILDNEEMTEKALRSIRRLKAKMAKEEERKNEKEEENLKPYTMEEIEARLERSEAEIAAGLGISGKEMNRRIEEYRTGLWK